MPSPRVAAVTVVALVATLLAGCSSDGGSAFGSAGPTTAGTGSSASSSSSGSSSGSSPESSSGPSSESSSGSSSPDGTEASNDYYSTTLPQGWTPQDESARGAIIAFYAGPTVEDFTVNVNVTREATAANLNDYQARAVAYLQSQLKVRDLSETRNETVGGEPALAYDYKLTQAGRQIHQGQVVVVHAGYGYVVTFSAIGEAYDDNEDAAAQIVTSLRWK